jgi:hypothetical protein
LETDHNLHAGNFISVLNLREGGTSVIHNFDIGDDYFADYRLQLTLTLSLAATTGISFNLGNDGPSVANNTNVVLGNGDIERRSMKRLDTELRGCRCIQYNVGFYRISDAYN